MLHLENSIFTNMIFAFTLKQKKKKIYQSEVVNKCSKEIVSTFYKDDNKNVLKCWIALLNLLYFAHDAAGWWSDFVEPFERGREVQR